MKGILLRDYYAVMHGGWILPVIQILAILVYPHPSVIKPVILCCAAGPELLFLSLSADHSADLDCLLPCTHAERILPEYLLSWVWTALIGALCLLTAGRFAISRYWIIALMLSAILVIDLIIPLFHLSAAQNHILFSGVALGVFIYFIPDSALLSSLTQEVQWRLLLYLFAGAAVLSPVSVVLSVWIQKRKEGILPQHAAGGASLKLSQIAAAFTYGAALTLIMFLSAEHLISNAGSVSLLFAISILFGTYLYQFQNQKQ